jgi:hypothetical protein
MFTGDCKSFFCEICIYNQQQSNGNPGFSQLELPLSQRISNYTLKLTFDTALDSFSVCRHQTPFQLTNTKQAQNCTEEWGLQHKLTNKQGLAFVCSLEQRLDTQKA